MRRTRDRGFLEEEEEEEENQDRRWVRVWSRMSEWQGG